MDIDAAHHYASMICLFDREQDARAWDEMVHALDGAVPSNFRPVAFWRHERELWNVDLFAADAAGMVIGVHFSPDADVRVEIDGDGSSNEFRLFHAAVRKGGYETPETRIIMFVDRPYDAAQRYFQLAVLTESTPGFAPQLVLNPDGDCFYYKDIVPAASVVERIGYNEFRTRRPDPRTSYVQCIRFLPQNDFTWRAGLRNAIRKWRDEGAAVAPARDSGAVGLFISFDLEKREFISQVRYFSQLIDAAAQRFSEVDLYVHGMTGYVDEDGATREIMNRVLTAVEAREAGCLDEVIRNSRGVRRVVRLAGLDMKSKARAVAHVDFFAAPLGTACLLPMQAGVPGVTYCSPKFRESYGWLREGNALLVPDEYIRAGDGNPVSRPEWAVSDATGESYDVDLDYLMRVSNEILDKVAASSLPPHVMPAESGR